MNKKLIVEIISIRELFKEKTEWIIDCIQLSFEHSLIHLTYIN